MGRFGPETMAEMAAKKERRERIASAVYAAMRPGVYEGDPVEKGDYDDDYPLLAANAVEAADALIAALDAGKKKP